MCRLINLILLYLFTIQPLFAEHRTSNFIIINEVKTVGEDNFLDEFVELLNISDSLFDIGGYSLIFYRSDGLPYGASETTMGDGKLYPVLYTFPDETYIHPYHYYLLASPQYSEDKTPDAIMGENLLSNGQLILVDSTLTDTLDAVSWGDIDLMVTDEGLPAKYLEPTGGPPVSPDLWPSPQYSIQRDPEGKDTNDNYADFKMRNFTTPMNSEDSIKVILPNSLTASIQDGNLMIHWKTLSQTLDLSFNIYYRFAGENEWNIVDPGTSLTHEVKSDTNYYRYYHNGIDIDSRYEFKIKENDFSNNSRFSDIITVDAKELIIQGSYVSEAQPKLFTLAQNFPNPFNPTTTIMVSMLEEAQLTLNIYNLTGQKIRMLFEGMKNPGIYPFIWNGRDENYKVVPNGEYIYELRVDNRFIQSKKMVILK